MSASVITTDASDRYHASTDCAWFQAGRRGSDSQGATLHDVREMTADAAQSIGRRPCPRCITA